MFDQIAIPSDKKAMLPLLGHSRSSTYRFYVKKHNIRYHIYRCTKKTNYKVHNCF